EDTTHTWKVRMQDVSQVGGIIDLFDPTNGIATLPSNYKLFPVEFGGSPVVGATYNVQLLNGGKDYQGNRTLYSLFPMRVNMSARWLNLLPGVKKSRYFPDGVPESTIKNRCMQDIVRSSSGATIEIWDPGTGYVRDPLTGDTTDWIEVGSTTPHWKIVTWSTMWNMDLLNIGVNGPEESVESGDLTYTNYTRGDSPVTIGGSGSMEYKFSYLTPSEPDTYTIQVIASVDLELRAVYRWYEVKRKRGKLCYDDRGDYIDPVPGGRSGVKYDSFGNVESYDPPHSSVDWIHGPFYCLVTGKGSKSAADTKSVTNPRPDIYHVMVRDTTPPSTVYFENSNPLYGTTGDLISEWNKIVDDPKNPEFITVKVVDNNPSLANEDLRKNKVTVKPGGPDDWRYDETTFKMSFYYVAGLYDYYLPTRGQYCGDPGYEHPTGCDCLPVYKDKFAWIKVGELGANSAELSGATYSKGGELVSECKQRGDIGGEFDAAYSILTWKIPVADLKEPLPWHLATTSRAYTDTWGNEHPGWGNGRILKFLACVNDGSGHEVPADWEDEIKPLDKTLYDVEGWEARNSQVKHKSAAINAKTPYIRDARGTEIVNATREPDFRLPPGYPPTKYFGEYGTIKVYDNDRPFLRVNVTDSSLRRPLPQTFSFGNIWYGDFKRQAFQKAKSRGSDVYTQSNQDILGNNLFRLYMDNLETGTQTSLWNFEDGGNSPTGMQDQGNLIGRKKFKPWFFALHAKQTELPFTLYSPLDNRTHGYWVPEDTRLRYDFINYGSDIKAFDNINTYLKGGNEPGGIITKSPKPEWMPRVVLTEGKPIGGTQYPDEGSVIFRRPNRGETSVSSDEYSLFAEVFDYADDDRIDLFGGPLSRSVKIYFFVTPVDMRRFTLQEKPQTE
ncbi:MAG: hypothetical protein QGH40_01510, partial [bacterium]|nr:hypothetical protein [bacterium]